LTLADATLREVPGLHLDHVGAGRSNLRFDRGLRARAERDHRDHSGHADDHAEHGERRAHLVPVERLQRHAKNHKD
jgi:hypothetical protein